MAYKKMNYKGEATLSSVIFALLIVIGIFTGMFLFMQQQGEIANVTIDEKYNSTYTKLTQSRSSISSNIMDIKDNIKSISEADSVYQVAWNGLKGLGNTLKLPLAFIDDTINVAEAFTSIDLPGWAHDLIITAIIVLVVLLILAILKGEQKL